MVPKTILVNKPIHGDALAWLAGKARVITLYEASSDEILATLPQAHGFLLGTGFTFGPAEMDLAAKLEVIGRHGVGLDSVDVPAATERGIPVVYTPYGPTESTAEHALLLILATARRLSELDRAVRSGNFRLRDRPAAMGHELEGKTLGMVGFGRIGRRVAGMCRDGLHMVTYAFDPYLEPETIVASGAIPAADLLELVGKADVVSVHTPLTPESRHLIDRSVIRAMKPGAILINTSRGPVIDEQALIEALQDGHLGGAGLDVFDPQPPAPENPLLRFDQVVLTPHVGSFTHEGRRRMSMTVSEDILSVLQGEQPKFLANPEVWIHRRRPEPT